MTRSGFFRNALAILFAAALMLPGAVGASAAPARPLASAPGLDSVILPPDLGQSGMQVYVPETGHTLRGYFLDYWRANGAASIYGYPISEPFASSDGYYSQAFENGIFQFRIELVWTDLPSVSLMPISRQLLDLQQDGFRKDGRRSAGGADPQLAAWLPVGYDSQQAADAWNSGGTWIEATGHTVPASFLSWIYANEGFAYLGNPISEPMAARGVTIQYYDGGALMVGSDGVVRLAPLGREYARKFGIETRKVDQGDLPVYDELLFWNGDNPNPLGDPYSPGKKWIDVNIDTQTLTAYQGDTVISQTLVSTGIDPNHTEVGTFHVRYKMDITDMAGTVNANGEVVTLGVEEAAAAGAGEIEGESPYMVHDIPWVMYFDREAEALHGAYWHNNFGNRMSHGCVNLPVPYAQWLFSWAPIGTMVVVHETGRIPGEETPTPTDG